MNGFNIAELIDRYDAVLNEKLKRLSMFELELSDGEAYRPPTLKDGLAIYNEIVTLASKHIDSCGFKSVVVPASGGADSTFMLKILRDAADRLFSQTGKRVMIIGFTLPCVYLQSDNEYFDDMGRWACELYCDDWASVNVGECHQFLMEHLFNTSTVKMHSGSSLETLQQTLMPDYSAKEKRVDGGNVAARLRMIFAYGIAKQLGGAQCSTDNLSEGLTGFWTLCGDEGTFKYIQGLFKGLEQPIVMAAAGIPSPFFMQKETDGLGVGDGDVSQLYGELYTGRETYVDVDTVLINMLDGAPYPDPRNPTVKYEHHPVVMWNKRTEFKRNIYSIGRSAIGLQPITGLHFAI